MACFSQKSLSLEVQSQLKTLTTLRGYMHWLLCETCLFLMRGVYVQDLVSGEGKRMRHRCNFLTRLTLQKVTSKRTKTTRK
jgi:hypothetical protein